MLDAAGAGIRPGAVIPMLRLEHIASIVAALLRLDLPDVDGTLLPGVLSTVVENRSSDRPQRESLTVVSGRTV